MSTKSTIAAITPNGNVEQIYCHYDGYIDGVGKKLLLHYTENKKIVESMNLGDLSSLGNEIGEKHNFNHFFLYDKNYDIKYGDWCTSYSRDRVDTDTEKSVYETFEEYLAQAVFQEYNYLWNGVEWFIMDFDRMSKKLHKSVYHPFILLADVFFLQKIST